MADFYTGIYNPDVLSCLANLSNDEVFTPPEVANQMLDMLPQELFSDPNTTFLDPACKSGVFLREIAKRLITGLEPSMPDLATRIDHIFKKQLFAISITELTSLLSRRSTYCSKYPNSIYSVTTFDTPEGNIRFKKTRHRWEKGKCIFCGASQSEYDRDESLETHAYEFIHTTRPQEILKMKFDVIIGNPPYQLSVGNTSGNSSKAKSIYHLFVSQATKLKPKYLCMITPSRWMTRTTEGIPDTWVDEMIDSNKIKIMHDFIVAGECFPGVEIKGGVNYFLWDRDYNGECEYHLHSGGDDGVSVQTRQLNFKGSGVVIRDNMAVNIVEKIVKVDGDYISNEASNFSSLVSPKDFYTNKETLTSSWKDYRTTKDSRYSLQYFVNKGIHKIDYAYIRPECVSKNLSTSKLHKVYISAAYGAGEGYPHQIIGKPFYGPANSVCSQTYLVIGYNQSFTKENCENIISYINTKFFRYLVGMKKKTQNGPRSVYQFVPLQDFSKPWTDEELYAKYGLTDEEIKFIEAMIKPMDLNAEE